MSAKPKPVGTFSNGEVIRAYREIQSELAAMDRAVQCLVGQNRETMQRMEAMEKRHSAERSTWNRERAQLVKDLRDQMRRKEAVLEMVGRAFVLRQEISSPEGAPHFFDEADLKRYMSECDRPMHGNSGN